MHMHRILFVVLLLLPLMGRSQTTLQSLLQARGETLAATIAARMPGNGREAFRAFLESVAEELKRHGNARDASRLSRFPDGADLSNAAWLIHTFALGYYRDSIIAETARLIRFRTFATDVPNQENPEFERQKEYLGTLAGSLGLHFRDCDGFVQEIWIGDGPGSFGMMSHSDVQPVKEGEWSFDPWGGEVVDGTIRGRGAIDDKGPIVAMMYGMRAILDSGIPVRKKIILLVGTDEESANKDVSTYLANHPAPDQTIVVDSNFPVVCAEKGWCGVWLELPLHSAVPPGKGLVVTRISAGFSPSIVPATAVALIAGRETDLRSAADTLRARAATFMATHPRSRIEIGGTDDTISVTTFGKSVHSSVPATGHNALMDLLVFLDTSVRALPNAYSLLAAFGARYIGMELDGASLGIRHHDAFMGDVTVAGNMFGTTDTTAQFMFNFRIPRGISHAKIERALNERYAGFNRAHAVVLKTTRYLSKPLYNDPAMPFVRKLLGIYNGVTGEHRNAQSIGGGTYAKRIPNAVVFGPALPDEEYLGHQPDEYIRIGTLETNIRILTHTMVMFSR